MTLLELLQLKAPSSLLTTVVNWIEGPLNNSIKGPRQRMPVNFPSTCNVWKYRKYLKPRLFTVPSLGLQTMRLDWWICCTSEEALFLSSSPRGSATVTQRFDRWVYVGHEGSITSSEHKTFWPLRTVADRKQLVLLSTVADHRTRGERMGADRVFDCRTVLAVSNLRRMILRWLRLSIGSSNYYPCLKIIIDLPSSMGYSVRQSELRLAMRYFLQMRYQIRIPPCTQQLLTSLVLLETWSTDQASNKVMFL